MEPIKICSQLSVRGQKKKKNHPAHYLQTADELGREEGGGGGVEYHTKSYPAHRFVWDAKVVCFFFLFSSSFFVPEWCLHDTDPETPKPENFLLFWRHKCLLVATCVHVVKLRAPANTSQSLDDYAHAVNYGFS